MRWSRLFASLGLLAASGCGSSFILLRIGSTLEIPGTVDSIEITTSDAKNPDRLLADIDLALVQGDTFPLDVLLEPSDDTPRMIRHRLTGWKNGQPVASSLVEHTWDPNVTNVAKLELVPLDP